MADKSKQIWRSLWQKDAVYYLPNVIRRGLTQSGIAPLLSLAVPNIGPVVLFDRQPWGKVSLDMRNNSAKDLFLIADGGFTQGPATGEVTVKICFEELLLTGQYLVLGDPAGGSAADVAADALGPIQPMAETAEPSQAQANIDQAKVYRAKLLKSDNGKQMVASYYDHNQTYSELFQLSSVKVQWTKHTTDDEAGTPQTAKFYADHTYTASKNPDANLNGTPDAKGYSPYNANAYWQQTLIMNSCYGGQKHWNEQGQTEKAKRYGDAGDAAGKFANATKPHSATPHTVNSVMDLVETSQPPSQAELDACREVQKPDWQRDLETHAERVGDHVYHELKARSSGADADYGAESMLIRGTYTGALPAFTLTVHGTARADGSMVFDRIDGSLPDMAVTLSPEADAALCRQVDKSLGDAPFITDLIKTRVLSSLSGETFRAYLGRVFNAARSQ